MRVGIYGDVHWSQNSSIIRSRGSNYSSRLENLIRSVNWAEGCAYTHGCSAVIILGDFFDANILDAESISALHEINWASISHVFITGNHETTVSSLEYSTSDIFKLCPNSVVISKPEHYLIEGTHAEFCYLPYIMEKDRQALDTYFPPKQADVNRIIFSHNDIKDIQYGPFKSTEGFTVDEIHSNCDLMFNGHIHHCQAVTEKIFHTGNLTGQNFTEDAFKFEHTMQILDTETLHFDIYENPHAYNFYKIDCTLVNSEQEFLNQFIKVKPNAVITLKVKEDMKAYAQAFLEANKQYIVESRIVIEHDLTSISQDNNSELIEGIDHLKQFEQYVLTNIGNTEVIHQELMKVMR